MDLDYKQLSRYWGDGINIDAKKIHLIRISEYAFHKEVTVLIKTTFAKSITLVPAYKPWDIKKLKFL